MRGFVGHHRDGFVLHTLDAVRPDDGAHGLAQLQRRAARVGTDVVYRAHAHAAHHALAVKAQRYIKNAIGPLHIAAAHVLQTVFYQAHRATEFARQVGHQNGVLEATFYAVAAAYIDIKMHAHRAAGQAQCLGQLVRVFGHLDRGPHVHDFRASFQAQATAKVSIGTVELRDQRTR